MKKLTKQEVNLKKFRRINDKSLRQMLLYRFLHQYGYDKGEVTASAIVDDIIRLIESYFIIAKPDADGLFLNYGKLVWMAIDVQDRPKKYQSIAQSRLKPVILTFLADEDVQSLKRGFTSKQLRIRRMVRWCEEAYEQGALLNQLDLALLLGCCDSVVSQYVNDYQRLSGKILPTRGNIHDLSGAITHKRQIIALYLQGYLTPTIAAKTNHSTESVDRYIKAFEAVRTTVNHGIADPDQIVHITKLSRKVVQQYLDLLPSQELLCQKESV